MRNRSQLCMSHLRGHLTPCTTGPTKTRLGILPAIGCKGLSDSTLLKRTQRVEFGSCRAKKRVCSVCFGGTCAAVRDTGKRINRRHNQENFWKVPGDRHGERKQSAAVSERVSERSVSERGVLGTERIRLCSRMWNGMRSQRSFFVWNLESLE